MTLKLRLCPCATGEAIEGILGESLTTEEGKRSAAQTAFNVLATLRCDVAVNKYTACIHVLRHFDWIQQREIRKAVEMRGKQHCY